MPGRTKWTRACRSIEEYGYLGHKRRHLRSPTGFVRLLVSLFALALIVPGASAWVAGPDRPHHGDLAEAAIAQLPVEWRALLEGNRDAFRAGALDPDGITDPDKGVPTFYHTYEPGSGTGGGVYRVELSLHEATMAMRDGAPDAEVAYQMGFMTHFIADLAVPFHTTDGLYEDERHAAYEKAAYDHRAEYDVGPSRAPREVDDPAAYAKAVAAESSAMGEELVAAWDAAGGAWSPEVARLTERAATLAVDAMADMLYTAFARADPARPEPAFDADMPVPGDLDDLGVSVRLLRDAHPAIVVAFFAALAALAVGAVVVSKRKRPSG